MSWADADAGADGEELVDENSDRSRLVKLASNLGAVLFMMEEFFGDGGTINDKV